METYDNFSIMNLPDKLLMKIFSSVRPMTTKMSLEQVCRIFQKLAKESESWENCNCLQFCLNAADMEVVKAMMTKFGFKDNSINGCAIPFHKWPLAIRQFSERTTLKIVSIAVGHFSMESDIFQPVKVALSSLTESQTPVKFFNFYRGTSRKDFDDFALWCIVRYHSTISNINLCLYMPETALYENSGLQLEVDIEFIDNFWPALQLCKNMKLFAIKSFYDCEMNDNFHFLHNAAIALGGSKVERISLQLRQTERSFQHGHLVDLCNPMEGDGVKIIELSTLINVPYDFLIEQINLFSLHLSDRARNRLEVLTLEVEWWLPKDWIEGRQLFMINMKEKFPNLRIFQVRLNSVFEPGGEYSSTIAILDSHMSVALSEPGLVKEAIFRNFSVDEILPLAISFGNLSKFHGYKFDLCPSKEDSSLQVNMTKPGLTFHVANLTETSNKRPKGSYGLVAYAAMEMHKDAGDQMIDPDMIMKALYPNPIVSLLSSRPPLPCNLL